MTVTRFTMPRWLRLLERLDDRLHASALPGLVSRPVCDLYEWGLRRAAEAAT